MQFLAHLDPKTLEPVGLWAFVDDAPPELHYVDDNALAYARETIGIKPAGWADSATRDDWLDFAEYLTDKTPYGAWWELIDSDLAPGDELEQRRRAWAGTSSATSSTRFAAAARRLRFHRRHAKLLSAQILGGQSVEFDADRPVSATISIWVSPDDERMAVVLGEGETIVDIDKALAYGLAFQHDRDLHVVLPDVDVEIAGIGRLPAARATLHRAAHLTAPVYVWSHHEADEILAGHPVRAARALIVPPPHEVRRLTRLDDELKVGEHDLGDRADWISNLAALAEVELGLDFSPRQSYLAWHIRGRQVLKAQRSSTGIRVTAGTDYAKHRSDKTMATVLDLAGPASAEDLAAVRTAIEVSIAERDAGTDSENLEHLLQARLAATDGVETLGLVGRLEREVPATRPSQRRAYIDLLGVDAAGDIHVIETKIDSDPMLGLQGLDYWTWATEHRSDLIELLRARGHDVSDDPEIRLDYVIGTKNDTGNPDLRYLARQLDAFDGSISWRIGLVTDWKDLDTTLQVAWSPRRTVPADHQAVNPRFATRLHQHLIEHHASTRVRLRGPLLTDIEAALPRAALPTYRGLSAAGKLHRFFTHVRSSQQFAVSLFGTLHGDALIAVARSIEPDITSVSRIDFEYVDPSDRLNEATNASPHRTQADVAIHATVGNGTRHLILIEVKLTETDFGHCTGYLDPNNDRIDGCHSPDGFASGPDRCFKLANHNRGGTRNYGLYVSAQPTGATGGCAFRTSNNQPMRNVALAQALVDAGEYDSATVALCAHDQHRALWRRWSEFKQTITSRNVSLADLPATRVLEQLDPGTTERLADHYRLDPAADDSARLVQAISYAQVVLQRVLGGGGVLEQISANTENQLNIDLAAEQRRLAQRLELLAEEARSARADLAPPLWGSRSEEP